MKERSRVNLSLLLVGSYDTVEPRRGFIEFFVEAFDWTKGDRVTELRDLSDGRTTKVSIRSVIEAIRLDLSSCTSAVF